VATKNLKIVAIAAAVVVVALIIGVANRGSLVTPKEEPKAAIVVQTSAQELEPDFDYAPPAARKYKRTMVTAARAVWGMNAPTAVFGAQVQQESAWNEQARSHVGAQGLAQFMPATADWIDDAYPYLGPNQPYNPTWALTALVRYDKHLWDRVEGVSECDRMAFALSAYNGGLKWVLRDQERAKHSGDDPLRYWESVEKHNAGRNASAWKENRGYPPRILNTLQPKYRLWGRTITCP
jgi:soluble lytic murein transglycosylase-like protein